MELTEESVKIKHMMGRKRMMQRKMCIGIMALYGLMSTALERSVWMWGWSQELWDCEMNASVKQISSKISGLLLTVIFVFVCDSCLRTVMMNTDIE